MDLFTYLLAKNDKFSLAHKGDLFSYLLGKNNAIPLKTAEGVSITIEALKTKINELKMTKESSQETTTGKNLFNYVDSLNSLSDGLTSVINEDGSITTTGVPTSNYVRVSSSINLNNILENGQKYTFSQTEQNTYLFMQVTRTNKSTGTSAYWGLNTMQNYTFTADLDTYNYFVYIQTNSMSTWGNNSRTITLSYQLEKNSDATNFEKYTGGIPSPNPDYPQEVKTVKGYRNLFDKSNAIDNYVINRNDNSSGTINGYMSSDYCEVMPNNNYYIGISYTSSNYGVIFYDTNKNYISGERLNNTFITPNNCYYVRFTFRKDNYDVDDIQLIEGDTALPYVPYGNNYVAVNVSNGTITNSYTIPLNGNEIVGIGDYKDELIVDKKGHCWLNKKTGKVVLNGSEEGWNENTNQRGLFYITIQNVNPDTSKKLALSNYYEGIIGNDFSGTNYTCFTFTNNRIFIINNDYQNNLAGFKTWLSTHNTIVYYVLAESVLIDLETTIDLKLFKGVNNITNSEDMTMIIKYY